MSNPATELLIATNRALRAALRAEMTATRIAFFGPPTQPTPTTPALETPSEAWLQKRDEVEQRTGAKLRKFYTE